MVHVTLITEVTCGLEGKCNSVEILGAYLPKLLVMFSCPVVVESEQSIFSRQEQIQSLTLSTGVPFLMACM